MVLNINSNQNGFKFSKKVTRFKSGTSSYAVPRNLSVTNKCTISVTSDTCIVSPYPAYVGTHQITVTYEDKTTEIIDLKFTANAISTSQSTDTSTSTGSTTTPPPPPPPVPTVITEKYLGNIYNNSGVDFGEKKLQGLRSPSAIIEMEEFLYIAVGYPEGKSGIMRVLHNNTSYFREEFDIAYHGSFVGEVVDFVKINDTQFAALIFDPAADADDNGYSSRLRAAVVIYDRNGQVVVPNGQRIRCTYQDSTTPYLSLVGAYISFNPSIKPLAIDVVGSQLFIYIKIDGQNKFYTISLTDYTTNFNLIEIGADYENNYIKNNISVSKNLAIVNAKILASGQSSPIIDNKTYTYQDFNRDNFKVRACIGTNKYYVSDPGNSRILVYDKNNSAYLREINYVPMNYNFSVCTNNIKRLFVGTMELEMNYSTLSAKVVANWNWNLPSDFKNTLNDKINVLKNVVEFNGKTLAIATKLINNQEYPTIVELHPISGVIIGRTYESNANLFIDKSHNIYQWKFNLDVGGTASLFKNDTKLWDIQVDSNSALSIENAQIYITDKEELVVFNPNKIHKGFHLTWIKDGKILYNAMPSVVGTNAIYPTGDAFDIGNQVEYAGGLRVFGVGNKVFVTYVGEFWGGAGNQTWLHFCYEDGKFIKRFGKTYQEASAIDGKVSPRFFAGNAKWGGVNFVNGKYYLFTNCEHSGCIPAIEISGL